MRASSVRTGPGGARGPRHWPRWGGSAVEYAASLPLLLIILTGLWEVGRVTEVEEIMWNAAREAARDASLGQDNLQTVGTNLLAYLQGADKTAFPSGHTTSMISPVISLPSNTYGYTCWDNTTNKELFTITFADTTNTSVTDPTDMAQLDIYQIGLSVPYSSIEWTSIVPVSGMTRLSVNVVWASMVDSPFAISPYLPAE